jgi:hypothetical protein
MQFLYFWSCRFRNARCFFGILVLRLPRRRMLFLEFWFYRFQDAGCIFWNSGTVTSKTSDAFFGILVLPLPRRRMLFWNSGSATSKTLVAFFGILVLPLPRRPMLFLEFWFSHFRSALYILLASDQNASNTPGAFLVTTVQPHPKRLIWYLFRGINAYKR